MASGGLRENAGRKRVGIIINTRVEEELIEQIDRYIHGLSRADRIRRCLTLGIEHNKQISENSICESNANTVAKFFKTFNKLLSILDCDENKQYEILSTYLLSVFTSTSPNYSEIGINEITHDAIIKELSKYEWSIDEYDTQNNLITPNIIGSVIEKIVNQKDMGAYYTPRDTTNYIAEYSIIFSLLCKCNLPTLAFDFYSQYNEPNNTNVLNSSNNPVEKFSNAVNELCEDEKLLVFKSIMDFSIVDPTCGTGAFIIAAADIFVEIYKQTNMYLYISLNDYVVNLFENCLYGVDIMPSAITLIQLRSKLYLYNLGISKNIADALDFNFICGDTLSSTNSTANAAFNWKKQFPKVFSNGGFDCIIGNPPYVESKNNTILDNDFKTKKCGNLYAYVFERSLNLLKDNCYMGMIVPISITSTQRMNPLRQLIFDNCENVYIANFSDRPSCLFAGVHQKLSIVFVKKTKPSNGCKIYTSSYNHWSKDERSFLFKSVYYSRTTKSFINETGIAKVGNETKTSILRKVLDMPYNLDNIISQTHYKNSFYLNQRMTFWTKCFSKPEPSKEYKQYSLNDKFDAKAFAALLNSSLFYLLWETYSDCWHVTNSDLLNLRFNDKIMSENIQKQLVRLEEKLENKLYENREYIYTKQTDYIYVHRKCYNEIKQIDEYVAKLYDLTTDEIIFIQNYNAKYRLSASKSMEEK